MTTGTPTSASPSQGNRFALLLLLLFAFALRIVALDRMGLAYDEAASAIMARATPVEIIDFHWNAAFEHPPFWVLLLHAWSRVAGQSEVALRLLPAFAGTLIVAMTWRLALTIWPGQVLLAFLSALLAASSPVLIYYSQEARMYTLVVFLLLLATYIVLRLRVTAQWRLVFAFWLACWLMLGLHYYSALALAIQAFVLIIDGLFSGRARQVPWGKLFVAYAGAILPLLVWMLFAPGFHTTLEVVLDRADEDPVTWQYFLGDLWRELTFGSIRWQPNYGRWGYAVAPLVVLGGLLALLGPKETKGSRTGVWIIVLVVLLPIVSGAIALRTLVPRYILWIVPLFYMLAALPAAFWWRRFRLGSALILLMLIGIDVLALQHYFGPYRKSDYRTMTTYLENYGDPEREILLMEAPRQHLLAKYYLAPAWQAYPMPTVELPEYWPVTAPPLVPEDEDNRILTWFESYDGLWVSYTSEIEVDRGEFLAKYLTAVAYREDCTQFLDVRLCHYVSPKQVSPEVLQMTPTLFGNELALTGVQASFYHPTPEITRILIQLDWHAQQKPSVDYKVALRLLDANGAEVDGEDDFPIGPLLPPTTWNQGDSKPGYVVLTVPSDRGQGCYSVQISLYDANTLEPSSYTFLTEPSSLPSTKPLTLAEVQVGDTMELLSPAESSAGIR